MTHYRNAYVTLDSVIQQLHQTDNPSFTTTSDATTVINSQSEQTRNLFKSLIYEVSDQLYDNWYRDFVPYDDTLEVFANSSAWNGWYRNGRGEYVFDLIKLHNRDLLSIDSITLAGTLISSAYYRLDTSDGYPAQKIIFDSDNITFPTSYTFSTSLVITGTWGYHEAPSRMWVDSGDTVQDGSGINPTVTNITVANGKNFDTYQYLKIEDEYLFITAISINTLTVERGVNGSTASTHALSTAISVYKQTASVAKEVRRLVIRAYHLRNGFNVVTAGDTIRDLTEGDFNLNIDERWSLGKV